MMTKFSDEIEARANLFVQSYLQTLFINAGLKIRINEFHKEKGIDFNVEIENREDKPNTLGMFFLQNKGVDEEIKPLVRGDNKGKISFQLDDVRQIQYFCSELDQPLIITLCDLKTNTIYWKAIQLSTDEYLSEVKEIVNKIKNGQRRGLSIQIYLDPQKTLVKNNNICLEEFELFMLDLKESKRIITYRNLHKTHVFDESDVDLIEVDKSLPILEQIYYYLNERFKEVVVLPARFWGDQYPFKKTEKSYFVYDSFSLYTDSSDVYDFFDSIDINSDGSIKFKDETFIANVENYEHKTKFILNVLNRNLVLSIASVANYKEVEIRYNESNSCECVECLYNRLKFGELVGKLNQPKNTILELDQQAYISYKLGYFVESAELFLKVHALAIDQKLQLKAFIVKCNLAKLFKFIKYSFSGQTASNELIETLEKYHNELDFELLKVQKEKSICRWIKENRFYHDLQHEINESYIKLKDYHFSQLYGGKGSNSHVWEVYTNYAILIAVLNCNHIVYDYYSEFKQLSESFTETLIASYSVHKSMYSRLENFEDWINGVLVLQGNAATMDKYAKRYFVNSIEYENNGKNNDGFIDLVRNFFTKDEQLINFLDKDNNSSYDNNYYFKEKYNEIFDNILVIASILKLRKEEDNEIAILLKDFLSWQTNIQLHRSIKFIRLFIYKKYDSINNDVLVDYFNLIFSSPRFHIDEYISTIAYTFKKKALSVNLNNELAINIKSYIDDVCPFCKVKHESATLIEFFKLINKEESKAFIEGKVLSILDAKYNWRLYYLSAMHEILGVDNHYFEQLISIQKPVANKPSFFSSYSRDEENRDFRLGAIINLCFKYNVDLGDHRFNHLRGFDPYYDWLMDMNGFDYSRFNPRWVSEYNTSYYINEIKKHPIVKGLIYDYLEKNHDPLLTGNFIKMYLK